jgi:predicted DNA-binding transcriptional regulator AlpA
MSKSKSAPKNPETEVTKEDIAKMAGCSVFKVGFVTMRDKWCFPKPVRLGPKSKILYSKAEVATWLESNDLKSFVFTAEDRAPVRTHKKEKNEIDSSAAAKLHIGARPKKFNAFGTSIRVHVPERNDYIPPDPRLSRASNCADHRLAL